MKKKTDLNTDIKTDPRFLQSDEVNETDVTNDERDMLDALDENSYVTENDLDKAELDTTDEDGEPLEEKSMKDDLFGDDLDEPVEELYDDEEPDQDEEDTIS